MKRKKNFNQKAHRISFIKIGVLLLIICVVFAAILVSKTPKDSKIASNTSRANIQIDAFNPKLTQTTAPTITESRPTPGNIPLCPIDSAKPITLPCVCKGHQGIFTCQNRKCVVKNPFDTQALADFCNQYILCETSLDHGDGTYCVGKPVIYLYPTTDTYVDVTIKTQGKIVISDPLYPSDGWKNVLAHPNGKLEYMGKTYKELFYEIESGKVSRPKKGIVLSKNNLSNNLREKIILLGLTKKDEQDEFLEFWIPRLIKIDTPYIFFSVLEEEEKERLDSVLITPKPDTFIEFIASFAPLTNLESITPLTITPAPKRNGFTAVEWGGVIGDELP
jgi:hypothetical protein